jgi:type IV pilus assembly protein PilY1
MSKKAWGAIARTVAVLALAANSIPALAQFALSPVPTLVSAPPPTNIIMTIDDSGSMTYAFVPDSVGFSPGTNDNSPGNPNVTPTSNMVAFTSSDYNRLYYNPAITYAIPPNAAGKAVSSPTFNAAYLDGFNAAAGTIDLSAAYVATWAYTPGATRSNTVSPVQAVGNVAYYFTYTGGTGCQPPVPWNAPPADSCFTETVVSTTSGPKIPGVHPVAGWDETQNFANWYSFYRTRHLSIASAAAIAMSDPGLATVRLAWQTLNSCTSFTGDSPCTGWDGSVKDNRLRTFTDTATSTHRTDFYSWLFRIPAANSTPTRLAWNRAGQYFTTPGKDGPYGVDPNNNSSSDTELACVNNFQITMTDGEWNTNSEGGATAFCGTGVCQNEDTTGKTFPDGKTVYAPSYSTASSTSIYSDQNVGGLADIAFYYWSNNLRPDLTGSASAVMPYTPDTSTFNPITQSTDPYWPTWNPRNDPATWPHMVNFTIGVGLTGYLTLPGLVWYQDSFGGVPIGGALNSNGYSNLLAYRQACPDTGSPKNVPSPPACNWPTIAPNGAGGAINGPQPNSGSNPGNVYDLWHAAINSRGQAFSAESPQDLVGALKQILTRIEGQATGTSGAAGSTAALTTATTLYVGTYTASDWHGTLLAYGINAPGTTNAGAVISPPLWTTDTPGSIPAVANRHVYTSLASVPVPGSTSGVPASGHVFNATDTTLQQSPLWGLLATSAGNDQVNVVNYLLGSSADETPNGLLYRARPVSKLGDLVDSNPAYTYDENFGYQVLEVGTNPEASASYVTYVTKTKKQTGRPAMVYVGANDGMLHAFNAATGDSTVDKGPFGVEQFAYIPHSVVPNLPLLANPNYAHHFYVDSPPYVGDAYFNGGWKTVLVGATGAGGKGVFALDITNPQSFGPGNVLWDMDGTGAAGAVPAYGNGDADLGYTIGQPTVVRLNDTHWYAVFGNGYLSTNACPVLYLVRLDNGNLAQKLYASGGPNVPCTATPNGLGSPTPLDADGNGTTDYIYAGDVQGNMWKFDVRATNSTAWGMAALANQLQPGLLFTATTSATNGTPEALAGAPNLGLGPNGVMLYFSTGHFFATGDPGDTSTQSVYAIQDSGKAITSRASLVAQTYTTDPTNTFRTLSTNAVNLLGPNDGWVIDFTGGERVTQQPFLVGNVVVFVSEIPGGNPCKGGCSSFLFGLNAMTGGGGIDFFSANGAYYDSIVSGAGCLSGLTVVVESSTSVLTYGFGPNLGSTGGSGAGTATGGGGTPPGGTTGTGASKEAQPTCPANVDCNRDSTGKNEGRISWHEMVQ